MKNAIITSLKDTDLYKFTMGQFAFLGYRNIETEFAFINRTKHIKLAEIIKQSVLEEQLNYVKNGLTLSEADLNDFANLKNEYGENYISPLYIDFLRTVKLADFSIKKVDGQFDIRVHGAWPNASLWETHVMGIVNKLYYDSLGLSWEKLYDEGRKRLKAKIKLLKQHPELQFVEFGTRRRRSPVWQEEILGELSTHLPNQLLGTSNVSLAMKYNIQPKGTTAHELFMIMSGIMGGSDEGILKSHNRVIQEWNELYGRSFSVFPSDTYGSNFFFRDLTEEQAHTMKGPRHDSADPFVYGDEKVIPFYQKIGINPKDKQIFFSDGLTVESMIQLHKHFHGRIIDLYGPGTSLTNDLGVPAISIVFKPVKANGNNIVKLSDNISKATGDHEMIIRYKKIFDYDTVTHEEVVCTY